MFFCDLILFDCISKLSEKSVIFCRLQFFGHYKIPVQFWQNYSFFHVMLRLYLILFFYTLLYSLFRLCLNTKTCRKTSLPWSDHGMNPVRCLRLPAIREVIKQVFKPLQMPSLSQRALQGCINVVWKMPNDRECADVPRSQPAVLV